MKGGILFRGVSHLPHDLHALTGVNITIHRGMKNRLACMSQEQLVAARAVAVEPYNVHWL